MAPSRPISAFPLPNRLRDSRYLSQGALGRLAKPGAVDLRDAAGFEPGYGISRFLPVWGDDVLPVKPLEALMSGAGSDVEALIGTNAEEMNLFFVPTGVRAKAPGLIARWLLSRSRPRARAALKVYGLGRKGVRLGEAMTRAMTDLVFQWPARQYAATHQGRAWMYEMEWRWPTGHAACSTSADAIYRYCGCVHPVSAVSRLA